MSEDELRKARHDLRGRLNALKLCISAFEILETKDELLEFLAMIEQASDKTAVAMDELEAVQDRASTT